MNIYKLRHEVNDIPDTECGVYWFKLRFPTAPSIGIKSGNEDDAIHNLVEELKIFSQVINNINIASRITIKNRLMLMNVFQLGINPIEFSAQSKKLIKIFKSKSVPQLLTIVQLIQCAIDELPPVYIGITEKQSFKQRYDQHFGGATNLKSGLHDLGLGWDHLNFITFPQNDYDFIHHRDIEQIFHYILKPVLSRG